MAGIILTSPPTPPNADETLILYSENPISPVVPSALGVNSIALGYAATTNAPFSLAIGEQSLTRIQGSLMQASGRFSNTGDAQVGRYLLRTVTTTAIPVEMFVDGGAGTVRLILPDDSTWSFRVMVTAHRTDADDGHAGYELKGVIYRKSGAATTSIQGSIIKSVIAESNPPWDINITADTTYGALKLVATGQSGKTIRWVALVETVEITN